MSEEFCDGVKILLKRMESNPEEFKGQDNKWNSLIPKGSGGFIDWSHALTEEETKALAEGMRKIYRTIYTEKVMSTLLYSTEEEIIKPEWIAKPGSLVHISGSGGGGSGVFASNSTVAYNPYQTKIEEAKKLGLGELLRRKLAKL